MKDKEIIIRQFVNSELFGHLLAYTAQLSEIADSLYLELEYMQRQVSESGGSLDD